MPHAVKLLRVNPGLVLLPRVTAMSVKGRSVLLALARLMYINIFGHGFPWCAVEMVEDG